MRELLKQTLDFLDEGQDSVVVTIVDVDGSTPAKVGAKMLVTATSSKGTVGGGALEKQLIESARKILKSNCEGSLEKITTHEAGMLCGGRVTAFMEPLRCGQTLWVFGGGHIAASLVPILVSLGFRVTVVDNRQDFATKERFGEEVNTIVGEYTDLVHRIPEGSFAVIVTQGHKFDKDMLLRLASINPKLPYIGMIGSRRKVAKIFEELASEGIELEDNIYSPIGLDLGGNAPSQIAVSIAAEILAVSHGKAGLPHCRKKLRHSSEEKSFG